MKPLIKPRLQKLGRFYNRYLWRIWLVIIVLAVVGFFNYDKVVNLVLPTPSASVWEFGGAGITTGIIIMIVAIGVGVALMATGVAFPAGVIIILGSMLFFGAKIVGISAVMGMIMNFFQKYRWQVLIATVVILYFWIRRSSFSYTNHGPPPIGTIIRPNQ